MTGHHLEHTLARRCSYLEIDSEVIEDVKKGWLFIRNELDHILDQFYGRMGHIEFSDMNLDIRSLKLKQYRHWANLFSGSFSKDHVEQVRMSGIAHKRIGLSRADLTMGYAFILDQMAIVLERRMADDPVRLVRTIRALNKLAAIDVSLALCGCDAVLID